MHLSNPMKISFIPCLLISLSMLLSACRSGGGSEDPGSSDSALSLSQQSYQASADSSGIVTFSFNLPVGTAALQLASSAGSLRSLSGPAGDIFNQNSRLSTLQRANVSNLNYYAASVVGGGTYRAQYSVAAGQSVNLLVSSKGDRNLNSGTLKLNIVLLGPVAGSQDILDALDKSLEAARITFNRVGITLDTVISNFDGPARAPVPGDPLYQSIVSAQRPASVTVVLASERQGNKSGQFKYGTIGSAPFPVNPNANSVSVISISDITGGDGVFDSALNSNSRNNDQKRILGEEISRFVAQALGLPNCVTLQSNKVQSSDDIPDSPSCISLRSCEDDSSSRTNLMMSEPLRKSKDNQGVGTGNEFFPRDQLTSQQGQVLNNSVFVD